MQQAMQVREVSPADRPVQPRLRPVGAAGAAGVSAGGDLPPRRVEPRRTAEVGVRIVVADDHTLVLDAFAEMLRNVVGFDVVGTVSSSTHVVAAVQRARPAVLIMNVGMLDTDCLRIVEQVRRAVPTCGIALIAAKPTRPLVNRALEAGALSVVPKDARLSHLVMAVRGVAAGCLTVDSALISGSAPEAGQALTSREREVLSLTVKGASVKEIATDLFLSAGTVRNLSSTAIKKMKGRNRFDAALIANEQGWL